MAQLTKLTDSELVDEFERQTEYASDDFADYASGGSGSQWQKRERYISKIENEFTRRGLPYPPNKALQSNC